MRHQLRSALVLLVFLALITCEARTTRKRTKRPRQTTTTTTTSTTTTTTETTTTALPTTPVPEEEEEDHNIGPAYDFVHRVEGFHDADAHLEGEEIEEDDIDPHDDESEAERPPYLDSWKYRQGWPRYPLFLIILGG